MGVGSGDVAGALNVIASQFDLPETDASMLERVALFTVDDSMALLVLQRGPNADRVP